MSERPTGERDNGVNEALDHLRAAIQPEHVFLVDVGEDVPAEWSTPPSHPGDVATAAATDGAQASDAMDAGRLRSIADELLLHGILSMLGDNEPARMEARIDRAMRSIERLGPRLAERAHGAPGPTPLHGRLRHWNSRVVAVTGVLTAIIVVAITANLLVTTPTANAALTQIVEAGRDAPFRRYGFFMERQGPEGPLPARRGELDIGEEGRFVCRIEGNAGRAATTIGFDGEQYWLVPPNGPVRVGGAPGPIAKVTEIEGDIERLMLEPMLEELHRHYDVRFATDAGPEAGEGPIRLLAVRRHGRPHRRPDRVQLEARRGDLAITRFHATWDRRTGPQRMIGLDLRLLDAPPPEPGWYAHNAHHDAGRPVIEVRDTGERRGRGNRPRPDGPRPPRGGPPHDGPPPDGGPHIDGPHHDGPPPPPPPGGGRLDRPPGPRPEGPRPGRGRSQRQAGGNEVVGPPAPKGEGG